jgi:hypothetical protein
MGLVSKSVPIVFALAVAFGWGETLLESVELNWSNATINQAWLDLAFIANSNASLQDGNPDNWYPNIFGGTGRAIHTIDSSVAHNGAQAAQIRITIPGDSVTYGQDFDLPEGVQIQCGVFSQGSDGFLRVRSSGTDLAYTKIPSGGNWRLTEVQFETPAGGGQAAFYAGTGPTGSIWLDDAYCNIAGRDTNLLQNGSFEADGITDDAREWWVSQINQNSIDGQAVDSAYQLIAKSEQSSHAKVNRLNVIDLLKGRPDLVAERMQSVSTGCLGNDGDPGPLLGLKHKTMEDTGPVTFELLTKLAISLMSECPQPYAELADLYQSVYGYERASQLYSIAVAKSQPGPQRGRYAFLGGRLDTTWLGNTERAIHALTIAEQEPGWETAPWYHGAATMEIGRALEQAHKCEKARAAYQKVLRCSECSTRWSEAHEALKRLEECTPEN